jgi:hypothetical protein
LPACLPHSALVQTQKSLSTRDKSGYPPTTDIIPYDRR